MRWTAAILNVFGRYALSTVLLCALSGLAEAEDRQVISLDGTWDIAESVGPDTPPVQYSHRVPIPGLVHAATPEFEDVDLFDSNGFLHYYGSDHPDLANDFIFQVPKLPAQRYSRLTPAGVTHQRRNYFWYRRMFEAPPRRAVAILKVRKAQYGSQVWLNGRRVGGHLGCATAAFYDISPNILWHQRNELVIRVGAHPGVLAHGDGCGVDFENERWPPGIWDSVSLILSGNSHIEGLQVAPDVQKSRVVIQTRLRNYGAKSARFDLTQRVHEFHGSQSVASSLQTVYLGPGEQREILTTLELPNAKLWTPEEPNLYVVETTTGNDSLSTRFGMRTFRFDTPTQRAYLNGKLYFLRGGGIALNRFFQDAQSGQLPWNEEWVRKLLSSIPKSMHWNSIRSFAGALPERWLDIADESGLLIDYEYPLAYDLDKSLTTDKLIAEFSAWLRDSWNHPSIVLWDACDECTSPSLRDNVIKKVRSLDLSARPWEAGWAGPAGADDPVADHMYKLMANVLTESGRRNYSTPKDFDMTELETANGSARCPCSPPTGHALILNEYDWLWLNRDGSPTLLTQALYPKLPYPVSTADQRLETQAYLVAGLTEYWRAYRQYAGVLHYPYLLSSDRWAATSDSFADVRALALNPYFERYVSEAFKPLGVYVNFWQRTLQAGEKRSIQIMMVNDDDVERAGKVEMVVEDEHGAAVSKEAAPFSVANFGQETYTLDLQAPLTVGNYILKAIATSTGDVTVDPTVSRRHFKVLAATR